MSGRSGTGSINYPVIIPDIGKSGSQRIIESLSSKNTTSYRTGPNTFSFTHNSSRSNHPLDGDSQLCFKRDHDGGLSSSMHWSRTDGRFAAAYGSENDRMKYFRDRDGAGVAWEHKVRHSPHHSSHIETGVRHDNGPVSGFIRWVLGFN